MFDDKAIAALMMHEAPMRYGATAVYKFKPNLERKFQFKSRFGDDVSLSRHDKQSGELHLPRAVCPIGSFDMRDAGEKVTFPKTPTPLDNQVKLFDETAAFLKMGLSGVVCAYTGWGKTVLGYYAAAMVGRKTLVITTKDDVYQQWIEGAKRFLGLQDWQIGEIRGDKCEVQGPIFCVAMIHSLSKDGKYPDWIGKGFGLVIFDECHRVPADQFSEVVFMFPALLRLGLSATPRRADGKDLLVQAHIGPIRARTEAELMIPKVLRRATDWSCPRSMQFDAETQTNVVKRIPHSPGKTMHVEKIVARDVDRNALIASIAKDCYDKGRHLVVFSTLLDHLEAIKLQCVRLGLKASETGMYVGTQGKAEKMLREAEKTRPIIFATYSMMSEGTSLDWLDTCLLAMPRSNVVQTVGRIRRVHDHKRPPVVIDLVDNDSPVFQSYAKSRQRWYQSIGAEILDY
jgi:superfamily II DNA or RNA helicase